MAIKFRRNRTKIKIVEYTIYLSISELSLKKIAERLEKRVLEKHKAVRRWVKRLRKEKGVESLRQMLSQV